MSAKTSHPTERVVTSAALRDWALPATTGGKENRGRLLVVGGAASTPGAILLATLAALRAGAGKVQVAVPESIAIPLAMALPETGVMAMPETGGELSPQAAEQIVDLAGNADAVLVGPGMGDPDLAESLLSRVVPKLEGTLVVDALAMAYLTAHLDGVAHLDGRVVLSPNLGELAHTLGVDDASDDPLAHILDLAEKTGAVVASGTATTWIARPGADVVWRDESGGPGLGTAGAGDVKSGAIAGLCVRRADPDQAAVWATYAHGRAGERLAAGVGPTGFLARELLDEIPRVFVELSN